MVAGKASVTVGDIDASLRPREEVRDHCPLGWPGPPEPAVQGGNKHRGRGMFWKVCRGREHEAEHRAASAGCGVRPGPGL